MTGQPWAPSLYLTLPAVRSTDHGRLQAGYFPRLGLTVFQLDDGPLRDPVFTSVLVMPGPHDVTEEPTWYWAEEDSQPSAASYFSSRDSE
jgi:hypothetical protein